MQSRDDGDIGCFRWGIRGALCAAPSSPFARFAFYSQRPIVACSMKQMHIERVLFRRVPSVDTYENSSVCRRQWVSGRVARHSSRVFTYQSGERGAFAPLDSLVAWKMLPNKFLSSVSRRSFQPFRNFESRTINDTIRHLVEFVNAGRRLARRGGGCVDPQFSHVRKGCGDKQADSRSPESFAQSRSISSFTLVE